jgi:cell division protein FtsW
MAVARTDRSVIARWWRTVDHWMLLAILLLAAVGAILVMAASPAVADRIGFDSFHFVRRQLLFLGPAVALMIGLSLLSPLWVRRVASVGFIAALALLAATIVIGPDIKGASRWLPLGGFVLQPAEFIKPAFAVVAAWMLAEQARHREFPGLAITAALAAVVIAILMMQPDIGMAMVVGAVWFAQVFIAGLPLIFVVALAFVGVAAAAGAYAAFPHVASRIDRFLDPASGDTFQIETALAAFGNGGLLGRGPGEGIVKSILPDAHSDFIFAVAGEEFGLLVSLAIIGLFAFVVLRGMIRLLAESDLFVLLACSGILAQVGLQAVINMGVNMRLLPAKGITLPFISYGGSSLLGLAIGMGIVLALTRKRAGSRPAGALRPSSDPRRAQSVAQAGAAR